MDLEKDIIDLKKSITPIKTAKFLAGTVISCGAMAAVVASFRNPIQAAKGLTKLMMRLGIFVLGCKAGDLAEEYFNKTIDAVTDALKKTKEEMNNESGSNK